jgi:hypothetical protein
MSLTLVTAFFDISHAADANHSSRPLNFYLENGQATLSQPYPMVIFCDPQIKPAIQAIRNAVCPGNKTEYIEKNITEYDLYKNCWNIVKQSREGSVLYATHRNTPSYSIVTNFKMQALKTAKDCNFFNTSHYAWIDFGGGHVCKDTMTPYLAEIALNLKPKIAACYIHYRSQKELESVKSYVPGGPCAIAGNFWTIEASLIDKAFAAWYALFYEQLSEGVAHADEQTFTLLYSRHPDYFNLYYGDYASVYTNYTYIRNDFHQIRWFFIQESVKKGAIPIAKKALETCFESNEKGALKLREEDKLVLRQFYDSL